jgi:hypothetical protein
MVFISGYENIHDAFVKHAAQFTDRPNWLPSIQQRIKSTGLGKVVSTYTVYQIKTN